jgi:hypothetical protein
MRTGKSRLRRSLVSLQELMQRIRHHTISEQVGEINAVLRGHYAYYGVAGNLRSLVKVYRVVERYRRRMLCSRSWAGSRLGRIQPDQRTDTVADTKTAPPISGAAETCSAVSQLPKSVGAGNPHATFCGNRGRATASGDPVPVVRSRRPTRQTSRRNPSAP